MPMFLSAEQLIIRGFVAHCRVLCRCSKYYRATQRSCFETETWIYVIFRSGHSIRHQGLSEFIGNTSNQWWICRGIMKPCPFLLSLFFFFPSVSSCTKTPLEPICREMTCFTRLHFVFDTLCSDSGQRWHPVGCRLWETWLVSEYEQDSYYNYSFLPSPCFSCLYCILFDSWDIFIAKPPEKYWIVSLCILLL